jgi:hypothetical protein
MRNLAIAMAAGSLSRDVSRTYPIVTGFKANDSSFNTYSSVKLLETLPLPWSSPGVHTGHCQSLRALTLALAPHKIIGT